MFVFLFSRTDPFGCFISVSFIVKETMLYIHFSAGFFQL